MRATGLRDKTALVTGALGGIGIAITRALLAEGARVVAADIDVSNSAQLSADSSRVRVATLDVRDALAIERLIEDVESQWGAIDYGVNAAGVLATGLIADTTEESWRRVFDINAGGVFNVSRALARRMQSRRHGSIVTVGSNAGGLPRSGMAAYGASKAAAMLFTRSLGLELAEFGIRCNVVAPGSTRTSMLAPLLETSGEEGLISGSLSTFKNGIPLKKLAEPDDIADAVVFLLSDRASHITMSVLYVDGGAALHE